MKILITGSSGFIGTALEKLLEEKNIEVVTFDIKNDPLEDIRDISTLQSKMSGVGGIVHLAAVSRVKTAHDNPLECINTNIGGLANVLESARLAKSNQNNPWVIFSSSREVYGDPAILPVDESSIRKAINIYGVSKLLGEDLCRIFSESYELKVRVLRLSNIYTGKNDRLGRVIPKFILQAMNNEDLFIHGTGEEIFDFTYISDTIQGILGCIYEIEGSSNLYDDFNLSSGIPISLKQLADSIIEKTQSKSKVVFAPSRSYDVNKFYANPSKAIKKLGFSPKVALDKGIELSIKELKSLTC